MRVGFHTLNRRASTAGLSAVLPSGHEGQICSPELCCLDLAEDSLHCQDELSLYAAYMSVVHTTWQLLASSLYAGACRNTVGDTNHAGVQRCSETTVRVFLYLHSSKRHPILLVGVSSCAVESWAQPCIQGPGIPPTQAVFSVSKPECIPCRWACTSVSPCGGSKTSLALGLLHLGL